MFLSLFLISLLVLSGCEQGSFSGYVTKDGKDDGKDDKDGKEGGESKSESDGKQRSPPGIPASMSSEQSPLLNCEDFVYSNCPSECTKICIPSSTRNPDDPLLDCQDVEGSCRSPFEEDGEGEVVEGVCVDIDGDGYGFLYTESVEGFEATCDVFDCDDNNFWVNPGIVEECDGNNYDCGLLCGNGIDDDCDGLRDSSDNQEVSENLQVFEDCTGACYSNEECSESWGYLCLDGLGDGYCDDGSWGPNFDCSVFEDDMGDCEEEELDFDCNGTPFVMTDEIESWLGDDICDYGQYGLDFNCEGYNWDGGDCECGENDLSRCIFDPPNADSCSENYMCVYQYCDGSLFAGSDFALIPEIGTTNGLDDITFSAIRGGGSPIVPKKEREVCRSGNCSFLTNLDLIGDGYCDELFNCAMWSYDDGDCDGTEGVPDVGTDYENVVIEEGIFNTDLVNTDIFISGTNPIEFLFSSFLQITEDIIVEGHDSVLGQGSEFYYFEKLIGEGETLEFTGLFLDANAIASGRIYDKTLYISYEDLQKELPDNLIIESHTIKVLDVQAGTTDRASLEIQSNTIRTNLKEGEKELYDINNDEIFDINIEILSIDEQKNVNVKVAYKYPEVSNNFQNLPPEFSPELFSTEKSEEFLKASAIFAMVLVMFIVSFLLIRKAVSLVKSKK